ncbi:hypothetical protein F4808DRAFT_429000 [Astrocystis sublimbata]|nr:hypothetical protein F4808DRAFT_429000 [Astrocystis sublimbata]
MDSHELSFSPDRCAQLHNHLLAEAIEHNVTARVERTLGIGLGIGLGLWGAGCGR